MLSQHDVDESYALALELCAGCRDYHMTRPYLVASGVRGGPARDRDVFAPMLERCVKPRSRLLIAGAADAGLLEFILDTLPAHELDITIADGCETPLQVCRRAAARRGVRIGTLNLDLVEFAAPGEVDVIVLHAILPHIPIAHRTDMLARLAQGLSHNGRLIVAYPVHAPGGSRPGLARRVVAGLSKNHIHLPDPPDQLLAALARFEESGGFEFDAESADVKKTFEEAGLQIIESIDSAPDSRRPRRYLVAGKTMRNTRSSVIETNPAHPSDIDRS